MAAPAHLYIYAGSTWRKKMRGQQRTMEWELNSHACRRSMRGFKALEYLETAPVRLVSICAISMIQVLFELKNGSSILRTEGHLAFVKIQGNLPMARFSETAIPMVDSVSPSRTC